MASADSFVHLHVHTEFSMLDGAAKNSKLFTEVERLGMPAVAMSDHGNMFGAYEFFQTAKQSSVKPIIGIEAYLAPASRFHKKQVFWADTRTKTQDDGGEGGKDVSGGGRFTHMTMWAENVQGLRNLYRLSSLASYEGYYGKPRMDRELIAEHAAGIIATTGCPSGEVQTRLRLGQFDEAIKAASDYQDMFGKDNYFLELMDHGLDIERNVRADLLKIAQQLDIPLLATNDSHYVTEDQSDAHDSLLCVGVGRNKDDPNRFRFNGSGYFIKTADQMRQLFSELPEACDNTLLIAERVGDYSEAFDYVDRMPQFDVPEGETQSSWLRKETEKGILLRYGPNPSQEVLDRVEKEFSVISPMGFDSYFLVVADICRYARENGIPIGPGRGSATGSIIAYAIRITELCPLEHGLLFERFLNPERISPPDVDLDFDDRQRDRMVRYVTEKYGAAYTAQVNTFSTIKAKAAVKDASRILGYPFAVGDKITKAMPPDVMGKGMPLTGMFDSAHPRFGEAGEIRSLYETDPDVHKVIDTAKGIEGLIRGTGVHAAAVILSSTPLLDLIPLHRRDKDGTIITGFDYPSCEAMGLVKMDFLGLRNLGVIDHALKVVKENRGTELTTENIPLDDETTFRLLGRGDTLGVFQLDGTAMRNLLKLMEPTRFEDIAAVLALYRPGPMAANAHINYAERKNGRQVITPIHPELEKALEPILGTTYHLLVYQEQIMAVSRELAGYSLGGADILRRAMGKKKKEVLEASFAEFQEGMRGNGYSDEAIQALWDVMLPFSGYAFNKSHTAGYGLVSYWTAYLKANYPAEYMAALLTSVDDDKTKMGVYLADARRLQIKVLPPDINESIADFTAIGNDVRFGLKAIRNVGANVIESLVATREAKGKFTSFSDFLAKVELTVCNKRVIESLIKAGAFDSLGHRRSALIACHEQAVDAVVEVKRAEQYGQYDLFASMDEPEAAGDDADQFGVDIDETIAEWNRKFLLAQERDMLGLYVSAHPLDGAQPILERNRDVRLIDLIDGDRTEGEVRVAGMITKVDRRVNKRGDTWAIVTIEDHDTGIDILFFPSSYLAVSMELMEDAVISVRGRLNERDGSLNIYGQELAPLDISSVENSQYPPIVVTMRPTQVVPNLVSEIKEILQAHEGDRPVQIHLRQRGGGVLKFALPGWKVDGGSSFMADMKQLLGPSALQS
ncbi:DNA polymerase III alpha subunit [Kribbella amoyensis]|uniref:DNA polymerase III subunit alpha n=1 Tax=Kribbella amoyensis TaxID=996641 RepID=A0A561BXB8_9ACTN|nr:DNA polymerase III subunit alpha [Kribbella amoyensis]TWD83507.1 DNA polymerase III alpha subunit [Kribbella amoyensis]